MKSTQHFLDQLDILSEYIGYYTGFKIKEIKYNFYKKDNEVIIDDSAFKAVESVASIFGIAPMIENERGLSVSLHRSMRSPMPFNYVVDGFNKICNKIDNPKEEIIKSIRKFK